MAATAAGLNSTFMEDGGKSANIVFDSANIHRPGVRPRPTIGP